MLIPSAAQFIKSYTFVTPGTGFPENYANIVALTSDVAAGNVLLDGASLPAAVSQREPHHSRTLLTQRNEVDVGTWTRYLYPHRISKEQRKAL